MNQERRTGQGRQTTKRGEVDAKNGSRDVVMDISWAVGMFFIFSYFFSYRFFILIEAARSPPWPPHKKGPKDIATDVS